MNVRQPAQRSHSGRPIDPPSTASRANDRLQPRDESPAPSGPRTHIYTGPGRPSPSVSGTKRHVGPHSRGRRQHGASRNRTMGRKLVELISPSASSSYASASSFSSFSTAQIRDVGVGAVRNKANSGDDCRGRRRRNTPAKQPTPVITLYIYTYLSPHDV